MSKLAVCVMGAVLAAASPAIAGDGTKLLPLLPEDTQLIMAFDVADARDSSLLLKSYDQLLAASPAAKTKLGELGLDPLKDLDTILLAGGGTDSLDAMGEAKTMVIVIEGRMQKDKLATIPNVTSSSYQGVTIWSNGDTDAAFIGDRLFFTRRGKMTGIVDLARNKGAAKGKNAAVSKKAKRLREALKTTDTSADVWMTVLVPEKNRDEMAKSGVVMSTVSAGINLASDVTVRLRVQTDSEASAQQSLAMVQGGLAQVTQAASSVGLAKAAKSLLIEQDKAALKLAVTLTEAELTTLLALAGVTP